MCSSGYKFIALTGPPGVGKTTLVKKVCEELRGRNITFSGFFTEEVREGTERIGFDIVSFNGARKPLARVKGRCDTKGPPVGKYVVDITSLESVAVPALSNEKNNQILIIDEIGKMELFSSSFCDLVSKHFSEKSIVILCTLPVSQQYLLVEMVRTHPNTKLIVVDKANRNTVSSEILKSMLEALN